MAVHWALGLVHVVVAVLAPFAHADLQVRSRQLHDQARLVAPLHLVDLAVSLDRRCPQTVSDTLAHGPAHRLGSAIVCRSMCLHQSSFDVTFANSSRCVSGDATLVPQYPNKHAQSLWISLSIFRHPSE